MYVIRCVTACRLLRGIAVVLAFTFLCNQFSRAATLPPRLSAALAWHAAISQRRALSLPSAALQQPLPMGDNSPERSVRTRLQTAHKVYVQNAGSDEHFPLATSAGYERFVATLQAWGRYTLVDTAAQADLVFQFRDVTETYVQDGTPESPGALVSYIPKFRLTIADPQSLQPLWSFVLPVSTGTRKKDKADRFAISVQNVTTQVRVLAGEQVSAQDLANLQQIGKHGHAGVWVLLGIIAVSAGVALLLKHKFDSKVEQNKQDQLEFCKKYNITPCVA